MGAPPQLCDPTVADAATINAPASVVNRFPSSGGSNVQFLNGGVRVPYESGASASGHKRHGSVALLREEETNSREESYGKARLESRLVPGFVGGQRPACSEREQTIFDTMWMTFGGGSKNRET